MKFFPADNYTIELVDDSSFALNDLRQNTKLTDSLVSEQTDRAFIGQVYENKFKVISSALGYGALCVFSGNFQGREGLIILRVHKVFKILSTILILLPIIAIVLILVQREIENPIDLILPALIGIIFIRFVFLEISFRIISKKGLNRLTEIIKISAIKKVA